jgi:hypothetical protein
MNKTLVAAVAALPVALSAVSAYSADVISRRNVIVEQPDQRDGVRIGYLDCNIGGGVGYVLGSAKEADCVFSSTVGSEPLDHYTGVVRKMGVDLGFTTRSRLIWAVFAPTAGYHHGSLGGLYQGATAEVTVGAGVGTNILVGGTSGSIHLQTISVTGQLGLNVAATGTSLTLSPTE